MSSRHQLRIKQLEQEVADLKHDLKMVLSKPVFNPDKAPPGQKLVLLTVGGICTIGHTGSDIKSWAQLPMKHATYLKRRRYTGSLD